MNLLDIAEEIGIRDFADIAIMSVMVYAVLIWFKGTRAAFVVLGMLMIGLLAVLSDRIGLELTKAVLGIFSAVALIGVVVIFQEEIKQFFEKLANPRLVRTLVSWKSRRNGSADATDELVRTLFDLGRQRIGALVVLKGRDSIGPFLDGGVDLDGRLSEPLLKSIFDPHSLGHDGAVVIENGSLRRFGVHLPLSKNLSKLRYAGTRHAAALGLSEVSDALCLAVSEERGTVTVARRGDLRVIEDPGELSLALAAFRAEGAPPENPRVWRILVRRNWKEKIIAVAVTLTLWYLLVYSKRPKDPGIPETKTGAAVTIPPRPPAASAISAPA